jgi:hypothetical protein
MALPCALDNQLLSTIANLELRPTIIGHGKSCQKIEGVGRNKKYPSVIIGNNIFYFYPFKHFRRDSQ